ncbi:MAG TPA: serine hydrolase [Thermoanaerobaculia bacterium]|nr:serine hydrolase [Thermoanaerobaculia bacterium]
MRTPAAVLLSVLAVVPLPAQPAPPFGDRASFETFVDGVMAGEMEAAHVPGAVVVVVRNGTVFFSKGYGYADLEARTPVLPERTIFRIGSITKVFTALAVMQLADRGKLELSDDVNRHLRTWKVPATYAQPITIANLLTHSSGLDEISPGRKTGDPKNLIPLGEFLSTRIVRRRAPGTMISYSTYNMALAGHVVESITGTHLRDYFAANIFTPLAMTRTTLGALPAAQRGDLATGYEFSHGRYKPLPFEYFHTYPASDINSTGADMGRFMLSQLGGGALGETRIVSEAATRQMQSRQFANHPRLIGMTYGWFENRRGGLAAIEHGGVMDGYSSLVYLAPRENFGIYVAGTIEDSNFPIAVRNAIVGRDFHAPQTEVPAVTPPLKTRLTRFAGSYRNDIWCHSCPALSRGFLPSPAKVTANQDGTISLWGGRWMQIEPMLFRLTSGQLDTGETMVAFRQDGEGRITHFFNGAWSHEKVALPPAVRVPLAKLRDYAGRYELAPERFLTVTLKGERLVAETSGEPSAELVPLSETEFTAVDADARVTFSKNGLILRYGGREMHATKLPRE